MLQSPIFITLPPGTLTAVCPGNGDEFIAGTAEGTLYVLSTSGALVCATATKMGSVSQVAYHPALGSVVTSETAVDASDRYESHSLQMYGYATATSTSPSAGASPDHQGLTLPAGVLSLSVCVSTGQIMTLLRNGVLVVFQSVDDAFELVLELELPGTSMLAANLHHSVLCVGCEGEVRIIGLHNTSTCTGPCGNECPNNATDLIFDEFGRCLNRVHPGATAGLAVVTAGEPTAGSTRRRIDTFRVVADVPFQDPSVTVSYSDASGIKCSSSQYSASVVALVSLEPTDCVQHIQYVTTDAPAKVLCVVVTRFRALSFLLDSSGAAPGTDCGPSSAKPCAQLVACHKWLSDDVVSAWVGDGYLMGLSASGCVEVWSGWLDHSQHPKSGRLHSEVQRWLHFRAPALVSVQDALSFDGSCMQFSVGSARSRLRMFGSRPHLVLCCTSESGGAPSGSDVGPSVLVYTNGNVLDLLRSATQQCLDAFVDDDGEGLLDSVRRGGSPVDSSSGSHRPAAPVGFDSLRGLADLPERKLLHLWALAELEGDRLWEGCVREQLQPGVQLARDRIHSLRAAAQLARLRMECWKALSLFARIAGRWSKVVPTTIANPRVWTWEELMYLLWMEVPVNDVVPDDLRHIGAGHTPIPDLVRVLAEFCWHEDPDSVRAGPSAAIRPLLAYLAELGTLVSDSVALPTWVSQLLESTPGSDTVQDDAFHALVELVVVLPLEALPTVVNVVLSSVPARCSAALQATPAVASDTLGVHCPCGSAAELCRTCSGGSLLLCLCSWRLGRFEGALQLLFKRPHSYRPSTAVELLKSSEDGESMLQMWARLTTTLILESDRAFAPHADATNSAFKAALFHLAEKAESSFILSKLPILASLSDYRDMVEQVAKKAVGTAAAAATARDLAGLLFVNE